MVVSRKSRSLKRSFLKIFISRYRLKKVRKVINILKN